jgi:hypothetical protein
MRQVTFAYACCTFAALPPIGLTRPLLGGLRLLSTGTASCPCPYFAGIYTDQLPAAAVVTNAQWTGVNQPTCNRVFKLYWCGAKPVQKRPCLPRQPYGVNRYAT